MTNAHKKIKKNYRRKHNLSVEYDIILVVSKVRQGRNQKFNTSPGTIKRG